MEVFDNSLKLQKYISKKKKTPNQKWMAEEILVLMEQRRKGNTKQPTNKQMGIVIQT